MKEKKRDDQSAIIQKRRVQVDRRRVSYIKFMVNDIINTCYCTCLIYITVWFIWYLIQNNDNKYQIFNLSHNHLKKITDHEVLL